MGKHDCKWQPNKPPKNDRHIEPNHLYYIYHYLSLSFTFYHTILESECAPFCLFFSWASSNAVRIWLTAKAGNGGEPLPNALRRPHLPKGGDNRREYPLDDLGDEIYGLWITNHGSDSWDASMMDVGEVSHCFPYHFQLSNTWMEKSTMILRKIHPWTEGPKRSKSMVFQFDVDQGQERETSLCGLDTCAPWPCLPFGILW